MSGRRFLAAELRREDNALHAALTDQLLQVFLAQPQGSCGEVHWAWAQGVGDGPARLAGRDWSVEGVFREGALVSGRASFGRVVLEGEFAVGEEAVFGLLRAGAFRFAGGGTAHVQLSGAAVTSAQYVQSPWQLRQGVSFAEEETRVGPDLLGQCRALSAHFLRAGAGWPIVAGEAYSPLGLFFRRFDFSRAAFPRLQGLLGLEMAAEELRGQLSREQLRLLGDAPAVGYSLALRVAGVEERCVLVVDDPLSPRAGWGALFSSPPMRFSLFVAEGRAQFETALRLHSPDAFAALLRRAASLPRIAGPAVIAELPAAEAPTLQAALREQREQTARLLRENARLRQEAEGSSRGEGAALGDLRQENEMLSRVNCSLKGFCAQKEEEFRAELAARADRVRELEGRLAAALSVAGDPREDAFVFRGELSGQGELSWPADGVTLRGLFSEGRFVAGEVRWRGFAFTGSLCRNRLSGAGRIADERLTLQARWEDNRLPDQRAEVTLREEGVAVDAACELRGGELICDSGEVYAVAAEGGRFELKA